MMEKKRSVSIIVAAIIALLTSGCINYEQETFLNSDMSGHTEICIFPNPEAYKAGLIASLDTHKQDTTDAATLLKDVKMKIKMKIDEQSLLGNLNLEAIKNKEFRQVEKDGVTYTYLSVEFDNIEDLYTKGHEVDISKNGQGNIIYKEYPKLSELLSEFSSEPSFDRIEPEYLKEFYVQYTLHMPGKIVKANTEDININVATWHIPLERAITEGITIIAEVKKP
ncbi:hypothetical protein ACFL1I_08495 [Candidatus Omnitrophota bacterium]